MAFIDLMKEKAKQDVMTIGLPESNDKRTLSQQHQVLKEKTADLIAQSERGEDHGWCSLAGSGHLQVLSLNRSGYRSEIRPLCRTLFKLREKGHDSRESTGDAKTDYITYGVMMVKKNMDLLQVLATQRQCRETGSSES